LVYYFLTNWLYATYLGLMILACFSWPIPFPTIDIETY
jgi:hypothetical protein